MPTQTQEKSEPKTKCQHVGCDCDVAQDQWYCSDYCSEQAKAEGADSDQDAGDAYCRCGHPQCHHHREPD